MTENDSHIVSFRTLLLVWIALLILTLATVAASHVDLGAWNVWLALSIASLKAGLVIAFFMHMKYESRLFKVFFFCALLTLAIFIGVTFFDVHYR